MKPATPIENYRKEVFSHKMRNNKIAKHDIYTNGNGQKIVVIIQELPGIGPKTLELADRFVQQEYTVVLPHLFGPIGKKATARNSIQVLCMQKEFKIFAKNESSPIVDFLSGLCSSLKTKHQVKGVAVIGMCLTGNFAISLMANEDVLAGFASQPSLPILSQKSLHMSADDIDKIKQRLDKIGPMHCGHFKKDKLCTRKKIDMIDKKFNTDNKQRIIFHKICGKGHAILTEDFVNEVGEPTHTALNEVFDYFNEQLSN